MFIIVKSKNKGCFALFTQMFLFRNMFFIASYYFHIDHAFIALTNF